MLTLSIFIQFTVIEMNGILPEKEINNLTKLNI